MVELNRFHAATHVAATITPQRSSKPSTRPTTQPCRQRDHKGLCHRKISNIVARSLRPRICTSRQTCAQYTPLKASASATSCHGDVLASLLEQRWAHLTPRILSVKHSCRNTCRQWPEEEILDQRKGIPSYQHGSSPINARYGGHPKTTGYL